MIRIFLKLFAMSHGVPVRIHTDDALVYYRAVARQHGFGLERRHGGWVLV